MLPGATYRVQLDQAFGFREAAALAPYLASLGVTHLYCSPSLEAVPGSTHGYDVVDPRCLASDLGGAEGHGELVRALRASGIGQVLDIVPNHMATHPANPWWWDVLENGPASRYAHYFDIDWEGPDERSASTVLVPVLGRGGELRRYRTLLRLRRELPELSEPRLDRVGVEVDEERSLLVVARGSVRVVANLGSAAHHVVLGRPTRLLAASEPGAGAGPTAVTVPPDAVAIAELAGG